MIPITKDNLYVYNNFTSYRFVKEKEIVKNVNMKIRSEETDVVNRCTGKEKNRDRYEHVAVGRWCQIDELSRNLYKQKCDAHRTAISRVADILMFRISVKTFGLNILSTSRCIEKVERIRPHV